MAHPGSRQRPSTVPETRQDAPANQDNRRFVSPSLLPQAPATRAYEVKFLVAETVAAEIKAWALERLKLDPHADPATGTYEVTTLYLDTPHFDVFHRAKDLKDAKYRLRRYSLGREVYLERKTRRKDRVEKRRTAVPVEELSRLGEATLLPGWAGEWFWEDVRARAFAPVCRLTYERTAFFGESDHGPFRLTLDRRIRGVASHDWGVERVDGEGRRIAPESVVCELKFRSAMPAAFKALVARLGLASSGVSKYRRACVATSLVSGRIPLDA
jgi:hypothetical protein